MPDRILENRRQPSRANPGTAGHRESRGKGRDVAVGDVVLYEHPDGPVCPWDVVSITPWADAGPEVHASFAAAEAERGPAVNPPKAVVLLYLARRLVPDELPPEPHRMAVSCPAGFTFRPYLGT